MLLLTADLSVVSRVAGEARRVGVSLAWSADVQDLVARPEAQAAALAIVDLSTPRLDLEAAVAALQALPGRPAIVAFGPHVHAARLAAARAAGCNEVLSRGQFHAQAGALLDRWGSLPTTETRRHGEDAPDPSERADDPRN